MNKMSDYFRLQESDLLDSAKQIFYASTRMKTDTQNFSFLHSACQFESRMRPELTFSVISISVTVSRQ